MTVSYTFKVANGQGIFNILRIWKGSVFKILWRELLVFLVLYSIASLIYRFGLDDEGRKKFESASKFCEEYLTYLPITFMLGFYVALVAGRWWEMFWLLPWLDKITTTFSSYFNGNDEYSKKVRKQFVRYLILMQTLTFRTICVPVKKRFPTITHIKEGGLLTEEEQNLVKSSTLSEANYFLLPFTWLIQMVTDIHDRQKNNTTKPFGDIFYKHMIKEINMYKINMASLACYDMVPLPLVYTQVVTIAVYSYFASCVIGRQYLSPKDHPMKHPDIYFPIFTVLQFIFIVGWLKVSEVMINPFGEDDDDFETNWLLDRNLEIGYYYADNISLTPPCIVGDTIETGPDGPSIPYTEGSVGCADQPWVGSITDMSVTEEEAKLLLNEPSRSKSEQKSSVFRKFSAVLLNGLSKRRSSSMVDHNTILRLENNLDRKKAFYENKGCSIVPEGVEKESPEVDSTEIQNEIQNETQNDIWMEPATGQQRPGFDPEEINSEQVAKDHLKF